MNQFPSREGPFPIRLHFEATEMDDMCLQALKKNRFLPSSPTPIRIEAFIESYFECTIEYEDLGPEILGCTEFTEKGRVKRVLVSKALAENVADVVARRRLNATFAHEGGHALFHASLFIVSGDQRQFGTENVDFQKRRILCRESDFSLGIQGRRAPVRWWEYQANRAIGGFLLPRPLVDVALKGLLKSALITGTLHLRDESREAAARTLSETFDVNPAAARIRLDALYPASGGQALF